MADFISSTIYALGSILGVVLQFILGITQLLSMLPDAIGMTNTAIASMPLILATFASGFVAISIVYLVIGR